MLKHVDILFYGRKDKKMVQKIAVGDLLSAETKRDPAAFFMRLREQGPLVQVENFLGRGKAWIVTDYEDAFDLLKDTRFTKDIRHVMEAGGVDEGLMGSDHPLMIMSHSMINADPPDHTRLRGLVSKAFTPKMIEQLRPRIQQITDGLLDEVEQRGEMDIISDFAYPLPITVISEMLGIPAGDRKQFRTWTQVMVNSGEQSLQAEETGHAIGGFFQYIKNLLQEKREHPGDDLLSKLVQVEENGDTLSENELVAMTFLLIVAGHETTVNLIGDGTLALLQHPEQMRQLRDNPSAIVTAVEELLRFTAPVGLSDERWALEDVVIHGTTIHRGELVYAALSGANSDTEKFHDPEALDVTRQENQHLSFGKGIHYCLGAPLARLEGQIAFGTLLRRLPNLELASDVETLEWNNNVMLRGLRSLPVRF
jgi:cytochrome P450